MIRSTRSTRSTRAAITLAFALFVAATAATAQEAKKPDEETAVTRTAGRGMTWAKLLHNSTYSIDEVGCGGCNAYTGDTLCSNALPVLCVKTEGAPNPGIGTDFNNGWIGGQIYLTPPTRGDQLGSLAGANALCASHFGPGYQMAEFHHPGGGWNWYAYGNVSNASRFWVHINDQPANCWNP